jgi:hypothetical protein
VPVHKGDAGGLEGSHKVHWQLVATFRGPGRGEVLQGSIVRRAVVHAARGGACGFRHERALDGVLLSGPRVAYYPSR